MISVGRVCVKIAGRDAGKKGAIIDLIDANFVLLDGQVRRKKCNIKHIEPTAVLIKIEKNASHESVVSEFKKIGIEIAEKKPKEKRERPRSVRKRKNSAALDEKKKPSKRRDASESKK